MQIGGFDGGTQGRVGDTGSGGLRRCVHAGPQDARRNVDRNMALFRRMVRQDPGLYHSGQQCQTQPQYVVHSQGTHWVILPSSITIIHY